MAYQKTEWVEHETIVSSINLNKIEEELESLSLYTATKAELNGKVDRAELVDLATKSELTNLATKDELTSLASKSEVESLKQSVSDGKSKVAAAITGKGVSTSAAASFDTMVANIGKIATGRKYATGTESVIMYNNGFGTMPSIEVTGLGFTPSVVVAVEENSRSRFLVYCFGSSFYTNIFDSTNAGMGMVGEGTFRLTAFSNDTTSTKYEWIAYE